MSEEKMNSCPVPKGALVIIGGSENKGEAPDPEKKEIPEDFERLQILKAFVKLTNRENPIIEIVTSATNEPEETFEDYMKAFKKLKLSNIYQIHHKTRDEVLNDKEVIERINKADAVFFTGGDQLKYTHVYGGTDFLTRLKERYIRDRIVVAGTSAGAMALSTPMIYAGDDEVQELGGMIKVTTGLEFLKDVCVDTHFVHRGRFIRIAQVVVTNPTAIGIGIEEDTAVIIRNGLDVEVVGSGTIIIIEGFSISESNIEDFTSKKPITIRDLKMHILSDTDTYTIPQSNPPHI